MFHKIQVLYTLYTTRLEGVDVYQKNDPPPWFHARQTVFFWQHRIVEFNLEQDFLDSSHDRLLLGQQPFEVDWLWLCEVLGQKSKHDAGIGFDGGRGKIWTFASWSAWMCFRTCHVFFLMRPGMFVCYTSAWFSQKKHSYLESHMGSYKGMTGASFLEKSIQLLHTRAIIYQKWNCQLPQSVTMPTCSMYGMFTYIIE